MAEVEEEMLCARCARADGLGTQVLESLVKALLFSRAEITDTASSVRAECVMLNKGPQVVAAVQALDDILHRMRDPQHKKMAMLRGLKVSAAGPA